MEHPWDETLRRFVTGAAIREESLAIVAHLLKGCPACAQKIRRLMQPPPVCHPSYDSALNRFDRGLIEALDSSVSPVQTLRTALGQLLEAEPATRPSGVRERRRLD